MNIRHPLALLLTLLVTGLPVAAQSPRAPQIAGIRVDARAARVSIAVPAGLRRIVLESTRRDQPEGWMPRAVRRLDGTEQTVVIDLPADAPHELLRVRADERDPLPDSFYSGHTNIPPVPLPEGASILLRGGVVDFDGAAPPAVDDGGSGRAVVESDIWKLAGNRLYFFNQYRGLQSIDVTRPDEPRLLGSLSFPAAGEQLYLPDDRHVALLLREDCRGDGYSGAAVAIVDVSADAPAEVARIAVPGRLFESRMIGSSLYVASQTYGPTAPEGEVWEMATVVSSFDLSQPAAPVGRGSHRIPGAATVVAATDHYFFVGLYASRDRSARATDLHVLDVSAPDGNVSPFAILRLSGYLRDKFKIDLQGDVLRLVVEDQETAERWTPVTRLTTWRLAPDGAGNHQPLGKLSLGAGENLFGTRFDGDRAYVVTYRRVDPLWIVDLADPAQPRILGELQIPGWSTYLHPMGDRLLTVGIDDTAGWRAAVQLFDVTDPARPALLSKVPLGDSWSVSEANGDEKALGVFPADGLVLIPFQGSGREGSLLGVQLIDLDRNSLKARGVIEHETFVPRRSAVVGSRVLSLSARELLTAAIADRDVPKVTARLQLSRPVDRLVAAGDHLLTFSGTDLEVAARMAPDVVLSRFSLGKLPILGATRDGDRLLVLQGVPATVSWAANDSGTQSIASTNAGSIQLRVLSLVGLPKVSELNSVEAPFPGTFAADFDALWPASDTVVWASVAGQGGYRGPWLALDTFAADAAFAPSGIPVDTRLWLPWGWGQPRTLVAFDVGDPARPTHRSTRVSGSQAVGASETFQGDGLVLFSEEFQESTVTGTNEVIWTESYFTEVPNPLNPDKPERVLATRQVTNLVPVVQWWQRHELRVVDYGAGGIDPVDRPPVAFPGELRGVAQGGHVLFSVGAGTGNATNELPKDVLEVSAYDGVRVYVGDSVTLANRNEETTRVHVSEAGIVVAAIGSWSNTETNRLLTFALEGSHLGRLAEVPLAGQPQDTALRGDTLLVREAGTTELWDLATPGSPRAIPAVDHGCVGYQLPRVSGSPAEGWWVPAGDYGTLFLGPREAGPRVR